MRLWDRPTNFVSEVVETHDEIIKYLMWIFDLREKSYYKIMSTYVGLITNVVFIVDLDSPFTEERILTFLKYIRGTPAARDAIVTILTFSNGAQVVSSEVIQTICEAFEAVGRCASLEDVASPSEFLAYLMN
eukprot:TRINITY_DN8000_c0_g1_i1.p1 TRINITY_DN8000_c0_g1~~TRINITY_DN8000_c0_g1_i1.p1  ORF type:complete len:132 (-),score=10.59 TRINITY_DN8000_c0_g1_i1:92-487(-)